MSWDEHKLKYTRITYILYIYLIYAYTCILNIYSTHIHYIMLSQWSLQYIKNLDTITVIQQEECINKSINIKNLKISL